MASCSFDTSVKLADGSAAGDDLLAPEAPIIQSGTLGGNGGGAFVPIGCPTGSVLVGFDSDFYLGNDQGAGFCEVRAMCAKLLVSGASVTLSNTELVPQEVPVGDCGDNRVALEAMRCPDDGVVVGLSAVRSGQYQAITEIELRCGAIDNTGFIFNRAYSDVWGDRVGSAGSRRTTDCADPTVATGFYGTAGIVIDSLGLLCQSLALPE